MAMSSRFAGPVGQGPQPVLAPGGVDVAVATAWREPPGGSGIGSKDVFIFDWAPDFGSVKFGGVTENLMIQGRALSGVDLRSIRQWLGENPHWSRWRLSRELATRWDWRNGAGR